MRKPLLLVLPVLPALALALGAAPSEAPGVLGYYRMPAVSGSTVAFVAEDDLWTVPLQGGLATRLTRTDGMEKYPRFSPDGRWIAFTGSYEGGGDVYVMPSSGGDAKRLTWNPEYDLVLGWTPDGKVLFRSEHGSGDGNTRTWTVSPDGGQPVPLPMKQSSWAAVSADGKTVAFDRFAVEWMHTKRYQGGLAPELWLGDLASKTFRRLTTWTGTDTFPMWHGDRLFFQSDRTGVMNLWSVKADGTDLQQHTNDDVDVRDPSIGGDTVVYQQGADLYAYDIPSAKARKLDVRLQTDRVWNHERHVSPMDHFDAWAPSPDGKRLYVEARGEIASFPVEEGRTIEITKGTPFRERTVEPSPDGKHVAAWSDEGGEEHLVVYDADGLGTPVAHSAASGGWHFPVAWSPKGDVLVWGDQTDTLWWYEPVSKKLVPIDHDPNLEIADYRFSPDGRWLAYVRTAANGNRVVWLYDRTTGTKTAATDADYNSYAPAWDPDGKYLYFASQRDFDARINGDDSSPQLATGPMGDMPELDAYFDRMARPYLIVLKAGEPSPFLPQDPLLGNEREEDATVITAEAPKKGKEAEKGKGAKKGGKAGAGAGGGDSKVIIDLKGLQDRTFALPVDADDVWRVEAVEGRVLWLTRDGLRLSDTDGPTLAPGDVHAMDLDDLTGKTVASGVADFRVSADGEKLFLEDHGVVRVMDAQSSTADGADTVSTAGWTTTVVPADEWKVIYGEAWRLYRDFFWSKQMVGVDWSGVKAKYEAELPRIGSRSDLSDVIGETIAELSNNHAYVWGGDAPHVAGASVGQLGCDLVPDPRSGYVRIGHVVGGQSWSDDRQSPLKASHVDVAEGDYLFAIDGRPTSASRDPQELLVGKADKDVVLTIGSTPDPADARPVLVHTVGSEGELRYREWVDANRAAVDAATGGKVGYVHVPDMGSDGLQTFAEAWFAQQDKQAFVVDVRNNGGGYIANLVIERLHRALVSLVEARNQDPIHEPWRAFEGPIVVLCDQRTASDGESFSQAVEDLKLGTVVGMPTWGGLVGFRYGKDLLDGGLSEPEFGFYSREGKWIVEGPGVQPDVVLDDDPTSLAAGKDLQLEKAIAVVQDQLAKAKPLPGVPEVPDKSLKAWRERNPVQTVP